MDKKTKLSFYQHIAQRARKNDQMAIAVLKKFVPDKAHVEEVLEGGIDVLVRYAGEKKNEQD